MGVDNGLSSRSPASRSDVLNEIGVSKLIESRKSFHGQHKLKPKDSSKNGKIAHSLLETAFP